MKKNSIGKLLYYALHAVGFFLLYLVLRNFDWKQFMGLFKLFSVTDYLLGLALLACVYLLKSIRWLLINRTFGIHLSYGTTLLYFLVAGFLSVITPGRLGEFSRIYFIKQKTSVSGIVATSSVVLDRVWDVLVLSMLGGISTVLIFGGFSVNTTSLLLIAAFFLGALAIILFPSLVFVPLKYFTRKREKLQKDMDQVYSDWKKNALRLFIPGFLTSLAAFLALALIPLIFAGKLGQDVGILPSVSAVSISNMLAFLPVTVGGFGTRELVFSEIWKLLEYSKETALTVSTAYFISNYLGSVVLGGASYGIWFRKHFSIKQLKSRQEKG